MSFAPSHLKNKEEYLDILTNNVILGGEGGNSSPDTLLSIHDLYHHTATEKIALSFYR